MKIDKEITHPSHPNHKLKLEYTEIPFKCDGCKEIGIGLKYKCQQCEFDLHKACALASPTITHPFYTKCNFQFYYKPPGPDLRKCDACNKQIKGGAFSYHCKKCGFDLHLCCANLPLVLDNEHTLLYLCHKITNPCHRCGGKGHGWSYRSDCKTYNLHVSCVKELLAESWEVMYFVSNNNNYYKGKDMQIMVPSLKGTLKNCHGRSSNGGKVYKCCQMAGEAVRVIVSAILGDPTAIIAAVIGGFISK